MKYYITKYALTKGIQEISEFSQLRSKEYIYPTIYKGYRIGVEAHATKEEACAVAEKMRVRKIQSLKKQLAKLEALRFCVEDNP